MKNIFVFCFVILSAAGVYLIVPSHETSGKNEKLKRTKQAIENRYIVVLNDEDKNGDKMASAEAESVSGELTQLYGGRIDKQFTRALKGYSVEMSAKEAEALSADARVKYVEEDAEISAANVQTGAVWGLDRIDQRTAALDGNYGYATSGSGAHVYVIDSGIRPTHADFGGRVRLSYDAVNDGQNGNDCYGHGTHVAGTVGSGTYGVAKNATLHAVRVLNCSGGGSSSNLIAAIDWITANHVSPAVANISITTNGISNALDAAVGNSVLSGVTYTIAAGNKNVDACAYSPARAPSAITVGATTATDQRLGYSNFGSCVDLFAPGNSVTSTWIGSDSATATLSGTSMASPHAAGVAALYLEANPTASPTDVAREMFGAATLGVVTDAGVNSPNLLLYSLINPDGGSNACAGTLFTGFLGGSVTANYHSDINGFFGDSGSYSGTVSGPAGSQFSVQLQRKKGSKWATLTSSPGINSTESVKYNSGAGTYRWRISGVAGSGSYSFCSVTP